MYPFNSNLLGPPEVARGLKEGRIRLVVECNQCDCIIEYDERGRRRRRKEWQKVWKTDVSMPKKGKSINNHKHELSQKPTQQMD